ncbi:MAG TPA: ATP-grasp domain-containing protein [Gemmatimonadaceae bacterium]|nr:ATP-grasp domain-containing protein [Gemmatimonadaceae bacterium]
MKIVVIHSADALEPPIDPVLEQLRAAIQACDHSVELLAVSDTVAPLVTALLGAAPDLVFNLAESFGGKSALESNVAALLNLLGLRYTGSSPAGLLLAGDKSLTKKVLSFHGIKTPEFATVFRGALDWAGNIEFPVIVKPPQEDASLGITSSSVVHDLRELFTRIDALQSEFQQPVLVEQFVEGREFYVGVLGNANARALPIMELDFSGFPAGVPRIASWEAKWGDDGAGSGEQFAGTRSIFPSDVPPALTERMQQAALEAFHALRLRDYARIDLRVTSDEQIFVIEVNPNCYLERESEFARAAAEGGLAYDALIARILELATARYSH